MGFADSIARFTGTVISIIQTRAELAAVEVEEEALRYFSYLMMALAAMFFLGLAMILVLVLVIALFWDTHRIAVLLGLIAVFAVAGGWFGIQLRNGYRQKPRLLGNTLGELSRDIESLKASH
jgi:uncharacterized membrane protein YqjE